MARRLDLVVANANAEAAKRNVSRATAEAREYDLHARLAQLLALRCVAPSVTT